MCPCVPMASLIFPLMPNFVHNSKGLNQRTSSGQKNICLITAFDLCVLKGTPVRTIRFRMILSGSDYGHFQKEPSGCKFPCHKFHFQTQNRSRWKYHRSIYRRHNKLFRRQKRLVLVFIPKPIRGENRCSPLSTKPDVKPQRVLLRQGIS